MPEEANASSTSADSFEQRTRFGSFEILRTEDGRQHLLGKGAFGRTYKARHIFLERTVALKIINDRFLTDSKARERFLGEARAAAKLSHPHIAQILDFGETDGILYYAMEYCSGGDLADYVKRNGPLSVVQTVQIGLQVAGALQCAHAASFIHRDLKPSNLMLASPDGPIVTKLIDFGLVIAKPAEDAEPLDPDDMPTIEQRFIGTPLFASPEQLLVQPLDSRSDFFSLGMTLWFLVLGAAPDPGNSAAIVAARLKPDSYAERLPRKLPQAFQAVLARLLEKKPENRFANATQLVAAFGKCAAGLGLPTAPISTFGAAPDEAGEEAGPPQPAPLEQIEAPVEECFTLQGQRGASATGADYEATSLTDQSTVWLHFLKPVIVEHAKVLERVRKNVGYLQRRAQPALVRVIALRAHTDRAIAVMEAPAGVDLLTASKAVGPTRLAEARPLLQAIANECDLLLAAGLPAPDLDPHRIFVTTPGNATPASFAGVTPRLIPLLLTRAEVAAIEGAPPAIDEPGAQFAALIYRLLSGRNLPAKPVLTPEDCVAVPGLAEEANRLLAHAVARQLVHGTCSELLADLLIAEGLMGASITRTHATATSATSPPSTRSLTATTTPPAPPTHHPEDPHTTGGVSPHTTQFTPLTPAASPPPPPPVVVHHERSAWPIILGALAALLLLCGVVGWFVLQPKTPAKWSFFSKSGTVRLQGDVPAHATARIGDRDAAMQKDGDGWRVTFDAASTPMPTTLAIEAIGYAPFKIDLAAPADVERMHEVSLKRAEGTLVFTGREGADYDHAVLKMTAQLPEEQSYVELERFTRGVELSADSEMHLSTGVYQLTLKGANERTVRPRVFSPVVIKSGETTPFALPPPFLGRFAGELTPAGSGAPASGHIRVEVIIEPGLSGTFVESGERGPRRAPLSDGRLDVDGMFVARVQSSLAVDGEPGFDQILTIKRSGDGALECELSEAPDENPAIERRLNRQPLPKSEYLAKGTLRAKAGGQ